MVGSVSETSLSMRGYSTAGIQGVVIQDLLGLERLKDRHPIKLPQAKLFSLTDRFKR